VKRKIPFAVRMESGGNNNVSDNNNQDHQRETTLKVRDEEIKEEITLDAKDLPQFFNSKMVARFWAMFPKVVIQMQ
jgi:hypothetical protein